MKTYFSFFLLFMNTMYVSWEQPTHFTDTFRNTFSRGNVEQCIADISYRASTFSAGKVHDRVKDVMYNIRILGTHYNQWLEGIRSDFSILFQDQNDDCGGGNYKGWSPQEIAELYWIIYGEKLNSDSVIQDG